MGERGTRLDTPDLLHRIHPLNHLAENGIAIAIRLRMVKARVIDRVDEELRGCRVGIAGRAIASQPMSLRRPFL
jgi:hypothetical protein